MSVCQKLGIILENKVVQKLSLKFFFWLKNAILGANFLLLTFIDRINFWITLFSKIMPNFWQLVTTPILEIISFDYGWF